MNQIHIKFDIFLIKNFETIHFDVFFHYILFNFIICIFFFHYILFNFIICILEKI